MKNLGILYFICVIMLSIVPCSDELEAHQQLNNSTETITKHQNNTADESCSPNCLCSCCGQSIVPSALLQLEIKTPFLKINNTIIAPNFQLDQISQHIWQPPKLA